MHAHDGIDALDAVSDRPDGAPADEMKSDVQESDGLSAGAARHREAGRHDGAWRKIVALLLVIAVACGGVAVGLNWNRWFGDGRAAVETEGEAWTGNEDTYTGEKNTDTIDIPGFAAMDLKAGAVTQSVNLYNPERNTCYFRITLLLADGTQLWQSKLIAPGNGLHEIELTQPLAEGAYQDAVLKYECFSLENQTQLNGSDIKLTLNVLA